MMLSEKRKKLFAVGKGLIGAYYRDDVSGRSAALVYYLLFSVFPFLVFISMLLGFLEIEPLAATRETSALFPKEVLDFANAYLDYVERIANGGLLFFGLVVSVTSCMRAVDILMRSVAQAYGATEKRKLFKRQLTILLYTLFLMAVIILTLVVVSVGKGFLSKFACLFSIAPESIELWDNLRFLILALTLFAALCSLYRVGTGEKLSVRYIFPGALASLAAWVGLSAVFSWYVENVAAYSLLYGSLGTIIVLMLWLFYSVTVIIMGAELNGALKKRASKENDKTTPARTEP